MRSEGPRRSIRWQALLQGTQDALFLLDRRRRVLYVNNAFERVAGLALSRARGLFCRKPQAPPVDAPQESHVAHLLTPPPDALRGRACRARRLLPGPVWVDVDFLPFQQEGEGYLVLGRLVPLPAEQTPPVMLPERLMALRQARTGEYVFDLLGPPSALLHRQARLAAELSSPVLIEGAPGTGRATFARVVFYNSSFRERPLASLDCSRLSARAVLGLVLTQRGEQAPAGYYLREPGCLPADAQARLAEQLEEASGPRLFAGCCSVEHLTPRLLDVLSVFRVQLPALLGRGDALPGLIAKMLQRLTEEGEGIEAEVTPAALDVLQSHTWPGNLTELFTVLRSARSRSDAQGPILRIDREHLPLALRVASEPTPGPPRPLELERVLEEAERRLIRLALDRTAGNRTLAAGLLSISRARLLRRIEALGLNGPEGEG